MLRIAIQTKGRLNEQSIELLRESGVMIGEEKRKFLMRASGLPVEILFLRDDDIPQTVAMGAADLGIVGYNEVQERGYAVDVIQKLGFGECRISLAVPKNVEYTGLDYFNGKRIATSYPNVLKNYFDQKGIKADIHTITGSVEIAPAAGLADAIFDIVSSGGTLISNGLVEVEKVLHSEAVLIATPGLDGEKMAMAQQLISRFESVQKGYGKKYLVLNLPVTALDEAVAMLPAMRSPTVIPLANSEWCSLQTVVDEKELWDIIEKLKAIGAEGILVLSLEKIVL
ncbi:MAG: ATP phosphoribosyltransferase [Bacteroidaceae bacterium]|nr:ATP phosphoribosyltransferase [Bacteroidaceae bacterium]MBQ3622502.1 ATP phosphoribosyltransferase [Bacteroidaceae bacterium]